MLFANMELSERAKQRIREQAGAAKTEMAEKPGRRSFVPRAWRMGTAAAVAAIMIVSGYALLQQPDATAPGGQPSASQPSPGGAAGGAISGSDLSALITTPLGSAEDAKAAFGEGLRLPAAAPEGFALTETVAVGEAGQPARDVVLTYAAGDKTLTFSASRMTASFPTDLFTSVQIGDAEGFVFEQAELTELYWSADGVQYAVIGPVTAEEALQIAESIR